MQPLTTRQRAVLSFIMSHVSKGVAKVSMRAIAEHLGLNGGASQVKDTIYVLALKGYIEIIRSECPQDGNSYRVLKKA